MDQNADNSGATVTVENIEAIAAYLGQSGQVGACAFNIYAGINIQANEMGVPRQSTYGESKWICCFRQQKSSV